MNYWLPILLGFFIGVALSSLVFFTWLSHHAREMRELVETLTMGMNRQTILMEDYIDRKTTNQETEL